MTDASSGTPCARCGRTGPVERGAAREVTVGTVAGLLEAGWVVACPAGHRAPPDVGDAVAAEVADQVPLAATRRLGRGDRCGRCEAPLTMPVRRTERTVPVAAVADLPVTTVRFDVPSTRCLACSTDQVPTRSQGDLLAAARALFDPATGGA